LTAAVQTENPGARASLRDSGRMFRRARRHSRAVQVLRIGVPLSVVLVAAGTYAVSLLNPLQALVKLPVDISGLVVSGTKITMQAPRLVGVTRDNRPYSLTARAAAQDITKPDVLELQDIKASMETQGRGAFEVLAKSGVYDSKADQLTLRQNILITSQAYEGRLSEAHVDVKKGYLRSDKPVEVQMKQGTINANRLEVENSGEVVRFANGVTMVMSTDAVDPTATGAVDRRTANAADGRAGGQ
jgi:lipopolysaccharide export system protein LptC